MRTPDAVLTWKDGRLRVLATLALPGAAIILSTSLPDFSRGRTMSAMFGFLIIAAALLLAGYGYFSAFRTDVRTSNVVILQLQILGVPVRRWSYSRQDVQSILLAWDDESPIANQWGPELGLHPVTLLLTNSRRRLAFVSKNAMLAEAVGAMFATHLEVSIAPREQRAASAPTEPVHAATAIPVRKLLFLLAAGALVVIILRFLRQA